MSEFVIINGGNYSVRRCHHPRLGDGIEIDFTEMYDPPNHLSFNLLQTISEMFGTNDIDFDDVSQRGCETCDYGSCYGFEIQVYNATKNPIQIRKEIKEKRK